MDVLGTLHFATALTAMSAGAIVIALPKGRRAHRAAGWVYAIAMLLLNGTALLIYDLFGRFGPFHFAAILSLLTVVMGLLAARRRRPRPWVAHHAAWMSWSVVGLYAAAASEISTRYLDVDFWGAVLAATLVVIAIGALLIRRHLPGAMQPFLPRTSGSSA